MSVGALGTLRPRSAFSATRQAGAWRSLEGGGDWSDDLMSMCEGERPVDCEG